MKNLLKSIGWAVLIVGLALSLAFGFNGLRLGGRFNAAKPLLYAGTVD